MLSVGRKTPNVEHSNLDFPTLDVVHPSRNLGVEYCRVWGVPTLSMGVWAIPTASVEVQLSSIRHLSRGDGKVTSAKCQA